MTGADYEALAARFRPIFADIAAGAAAREVSRELPVAPLRALADAGFGAVRVPVDDGGAGASITDLFRLLIELGTADSNLPQILRAHFGLVEERLTDAAGPARTRWLARAAAGDIVGNAVTERGDGAVGTSATRLHRDAAGWSVTGVKHYSTGTFYADWVAVGVADDRDEQAFAIVAARHPAVRIVDDWNGFGQRLTGSGTTVLEGVPVDPADVFWHAERTPHYLIAFYQLLLLASLVGVARAVVVDARAYVRDRRRVFSHGSGATPAADPLVQQVVGRLEAHAFAAEAITLAAVARLEDVNRARAAGVDVTELLEAAELATATAHGTVVQHVLDAATLLFEVGGASSVDRDKAFDRHWRNARTLSVHNPGIYKQRVVGDHVLNGTAPTYAWTVGTRS